MIMATFVVIGAKGGTGREIVRKLLARPSREVREVRAVVRPYDSAGHGVSHEVTLASKSAKVTAPTLEPS